MTGPLQIVLGTISVLFLLVSGVMAYRAVRAMVRIIRTGQPDSTRNGPVGARLKTLAVESLGHTPMLNWSSIGVAHHGEHRDVEHPLEQLTGVHCPSPRPAAVAERTVVQ